MNERSAVIDRYIYIEREREREGERTYVSQLKT